MRRDWIIADFGFWPATKQKGIIVIKLAEVTVICDDTLKTVQAEKQKVHENNGQLNAERSRKC